MQIARVISPVSLRESWTVLGDDDAPIAPVDRYLGYLTDIERSPNTVKAYAHDLKDWFGFLAERGLDWRTVRLDERNCQELWIGCVQGRLFYGSSRYASCSALRDHKMILVATDPRSANALSETGLVEQLPRIRQGVCRNLYTTHRVLR